MIFEKGPKLYNERKRASLTNGACITGCQPVEECKLSYTGGLGHCSEAVEAMSCKLGGGSLPYLTQQTYSGPRVRGAGQARQKYNSGDLRLATINELYSSWLIQNEQNRNAGFGVGVLWLTNEPMPGCLGAGQVWRELSWKLLALALKEFSRSAYPYLLRAGAGARR